MVSGCQGQFSGARIVLGAFLESGKRFRKLPSGDCSRHLLDWMWQVAGATNMDW